MEKKRLHQDIVFCIIVYVFCAAMFFFGRTIKGDARSYPFIVLTLMCVLNAILLVTTIIKSRKMSAEEIKEANTVRWSEIRFPLLVFIIILAYVVIIDLLGYFVATPLMMVGLMFLFGVRDWRIMVIVPIILLILIYVLFVWQLHVPLL